MVLADALDDSIYLCQACRVAGEEMGRDHQWVSSLADRMQHRIMERLEHVKINGHIDQRYPGNLNMSFSYVEGESLLMSLKEISVSSGSACTSASLGDHQL